MKKIHLDMDVLVVETFHAAGGEVGSSDSIEARALRNTAERHCSNAGHETCDFTCYC